MISAKKLLYMATQKFGVDYITEEGTSGAWKYRKWKSGRKECWYDTFGEASVNFTAWGNTFYADLDAPSFPFTFDSAPTAYITPYGAQSWVIGNYSRSATSVGKIRFASNSSGAHQAYCHIYVVGN